MFRGYAFPLVGVVGVLLIGWLDLHRTTPAALAPLNAEQRARVGRNLMSGQIIIVSCILAVMAVVAAFGNLYLGHPTWWAWLVGGPAWVMRVGCRLQAQARFNTFMADQRHPAPTAPAFDRLWVPRLLFGLTLCTGALGFTGNALMKGVTHGDLVDVVFGVVGVLATLWVLVFVLRQAGVSAGRSKLARTRA